MMDLTSLLLHRDACVLVLNKPTGVPVHTGTGPLMALDRYFPQLQFGLPRVPALAHRLDKDTSGCLVLGRHPEALRILGKLFEGGQVEKIYWAITKGTLPAAEGTIDLPLGPQSKRKDLWRMQVDLEEGKPSRTDYRVLKQLEEGTLVELIPQTGRTHQLRVHMAAIGCPILGDPIYGEGGAIPLCLHARSVTIPYHRNKPPIHVEAPLPMHMEGLLQ